MSGKVGVMSLMPSLITESAAEKYYSLASEWKPIVPRCLSSNVKIVLIPCPLHRVAIVQSVKLNSTSLLCL